MEEKELKYQVRLHLTPAFAKAARETPYSDSIKQLTDALKDQNAVLTCQYDEFRNFVAAAESHGQAGGPMVAWTRATLNDPVKAEKYLKVFIVNVAGEQLFSKDKAADLISAFKKLPPEIVTNIVRPSTDPARNPQPPRGHK
jgi:hypothetical protein